MASRATKANGELTDAAQIASLTTWVGNAGQQFMATTTPDMITDTQSEAIRLRWFDVPIDGINYSVGLNIHYGGSFGGVWFVDQRDANTNYSYEMHPHKSPRHNLSAAFLKTLRGHVKANADPKHQYWYTKIKHSFDGHQRFRDGTSDVYHGKNRNKTLTIPTRWRP